jgi:hypothetical protein
VNGFFHGLPVPTAFLAVSGDPLFHFDIIRYAGCNKDMMVPVQAFGCFQRLMAFAAPATANHK